MFKATGETGVKKRLPLHIFDIPVQEIRRGYRSDIYFWRQKVVLEKNKIHPEITMQIFQKKEALLCGIDEAISILKIGTGRYKDYKRAYKLFDRLFELKKIEREAFYFDKGAYVDTVKEKTYINQTLDILWEDHFNELKVEALHDGDEIEPWESVLHITGDASHFAHLETVYLGVLARRTKIATNVRNIVRAAGGKTVMYFPARFDHWEVQGGDGYAAHIGGAQAVSTPAQAEWWGAKSSGTVPHALIASLGGDTIKAAGLFADAYPKTNLIALVDFENDCVNTSLACAREFKERLWGVRLDTSENMVDKSMVRQMGEIKPTGVTPKLVELTRKALDKEGFDHVKIVVSGGFTAEKIAAFERIKVPVDAYGVGSSLMKGAFDFTADAVLLKGVHCAKAGRKYRPNSRLQNVSF